MKKNRKFHPAIDHQQAFDVWRELRSLSDMPDDLAIATAVQRVRDLSPFALSNTCSRTGEHRRLTIRAIERGLRHHGLHPAQSRELQRQDEIALARMQRRYAMRGEDAKALQQAAHHAGLLALSAAHQLVKLSQQLEGCDSMQAIQSICRALDRSGPLRSLHIALQRSKSAVLKALELSDLYPRAVEQANKITGESK